MFVQFIHDFPKAKLRQLAGEVCYIQGEEFFKSGNITNLKIYANSVSAKALGSASYRVCITVAHGNTNWSCDCSIGVTGRFCKHCVALGLTIHAISSKIEPSIKPRAFIDIKKYLFYFNKSELVDIIEGAINNGNEALAAKIFKMIYLKHEILSEVLVRNLNDTVNFDPSDISVEK